MGIERFTALRKQLENLPLRDLVANSVAAHTQEIEQLQREQLEQGRGKDTEKLEPSYKSGSYAKKKHQMNGGPGLGTPDLRLSGAYYQSITARVYADGLEMSATDFKAKYLTPRYPNAIGLNIVSIVHLQRELMLPYLRREIRRLINP